MDLTEEEHVEIHWAITYTIDVLKAKIEKVRIKEGYEPSDILRRKLKRLEALYLKFLHTK
jgi:hypothetical protein